MVNKDILWGRLGLFFLLFPRFARLRREEVRLETDPARSLLKRSPGSKAVSRQPVSMDSLEVGSLVLQAEKASKRCFRTRRPKIVTSENALIGKSNILMSYRSKGKDGGLRRKHALRS